MDNRQMAQDYQVNCANRHRCEEVFVIGDQVMLSASNIKLATNAKQPSWKLLHKFLGPYKIIKVISEVAYKLDLPSTLSIHPVFHVSLLTWYHDSDPNMFSNCIVPPPPPVILDTGPEYEVEYILDKQTFQCQVQYLIKWVGYSPHNASWELIKNLTNAAALIADFEHNLAGGQS